jgi:hypothetical protein
MIRNSDGLAVVYARPSSAQSVPIEQAVKGNTPLETTTEGGTTLQSQVVDWLIAATAIVLGGAQVEPEDGDEIEFVNAQGQTETYQVLPPVGADKCFRPADHLGTTLRIHTRLTGVS